MIDRTAQAGYVFTTPLGWRPASQANGIYISAPPPITSAQIWESDPALDASGTFVIYEGTGDAGDNLIRGRDLDELLASLDAWYEAHTGTLAVEHRATVVDGAPGAVTEHRTTRPELVWLDAVVIHEGRAYSLVIAGAADRRAELLQALDQLIAAVRWA